MSTSRSPRSSCTSSIKMSGLAIRSPCARLSRSGAPNPLHGSACSSNCLLRCRWMRYAREFLHSRVAVKMFQVERLEEGRYISIERSGDDRVAFEVGCKSFDQDQNQDPAHRTFASGQWMPTCAIVTSDCLRPAARWISSGRVETNQ
jgi:hypothetical protein